MHQRHGAYFPPSKCSRSIGVCSSLRGVRREENAMHESFDVVERAGERRQTASEWTTRCKLILALYSPSGINGRPSLSLLHPRYIFR